MESDQLTGKLVKWAFILQEYDFDIIHKADKANRDVDGLSWNPSSSEEVQGGMERWIWRLC
jgi:hypothetical protein